MSLEKPSSFFPVCAWFCDSTVFATSVLEKKVFKLYEIIARELKIKSYASMSFSCKKSPDFSCNLKNLSFKNYRERRRVEEVGAGLQFIVESKYFP